MPKFIEQTLLTVRARELAETSDPITIARGSLAYLLAMLETAIVDAEEIIASDRKLLAAGGKDAMRPPKFTTDRMEHLVEIADKVSRAAQRVNDMQNKTARTASEVKKAEEFIAIVLSDIIIEFVPNHLHERAFSEASRRLSTPGIGGGASQAANNGKAE